MLRWTTNRLHRSLTTSARRQIHSCTTFPPSSSAARQLALPLAFLSVKGWDAGLSGWSTWTRLFADAGYASLLIELDPSSTTAAASTSSKELLASLETDLVKLLAASDSPFPPVLFASQSSSLVAETYVSSHPLSALFLHDPTPPSSSSPLLPNKLPEFTYEPNFAIGVMSSLSDFQGSRLGKMAEEEGEDGWVKRVEGKRDEQGWKGVVDWLDENGL